MPASTSLRWPASLSRAALTISACAASILVPISASLNAIAWCSAIGLPNVWRCWAYAMASSKARMRDAAGAGGHVDPADLDAVHHLVEAAAQARVGPPRTADAGHR